MSRRLALAAVMCALAASDMVAQVALVEEGRAVFTRECASCHGDSGNGYGPASWVLRERPADLTTLSTRSRPLPKQRVRNIVTGRIRLQPSHGPSEMPYWRGTLDRQIDGARGLTEMDALIAFLERLQIHPYRSAPGLSADDLAAAGASLFARLCAGCHGNSAGPAGYVVGVTAPDLTTMHSRYAGPVDAARIFELIARNHVGGTGAMPAGYDILMRRGWTRAAAQKDLEAIAIYVASIQDHSRP